jgi:hypothetical protein
MISSGPNPGRKVRMGASRVLWQVAPLFDPMALGAANFWCGLRVANCEICSGGPEPRPLCECWRFYAFMVGRSFYHWQDEDCLLTNELITSHTSLPGFHTRPAYGARIGLEDIVIGPHSLRRTQRHLKGVKSRDGVGRATVG